MDREVTLSRRQLMQATGWTATGLTVTYMMGCPVLSALPTFSQPDETSGTSWLQIDARGRAILFCPRQEMGQGTSIGLAQIVAEELNLEVEHIDLELPSTADIPPALITAGSMSIALFSEPTARAAATLREAMRERAARLEGVDVATVRDAGGGFTLEDGRFLRYGEIARGEPMVLDADESREARLYTFDAGRPHRQIGRAAETFQARQIVTGGAVFASDVRVPDMVYGRAIQPPVRGAELARVDGSGASAVPGVIRTVIDRNANFVGVVAESPGAVDAAIEKLEVEWSPPVAFDQSDIDRLVDVDAALARGELEHVPLDDSMEVGTGWDVDLRLDVQVQSHAAQEPRAAVARFGVKDGEETVDLWTGSQDPFFIQRMASGLTGVSTERVVVHGMRMGGAFGGRELYEVERDVLLLARAVGRPVKVQWSRSDEFRAARNRPASSHRLRIRADREGRISDWWHAIASGHIIFARGRAPAWLLSGARLLTDIGVGRSSTPLYQAARKRLEIHDVDLPIDLGSWRSLGAAPNTFAIESAIDELARRRGDDPVDFRLKNIPTEQARVARCLHKVRELAERESLPPGGGRGRGFACGIYEENSFVATSADVFVDARSGDIRVLRMCCAQDVGLAINPGQLEAQIQGNLMWGIGMALTERVVIGTSEITSDNFDTYVIPGIQHAPEMEIAIISDPTIAPAGAGETALITAPPAIANAVRDATGRRHTRLPIQVA